MADIYNRSKRSEIMSRVRAVGTEPEIIVRRVAHGLGYRFRLHRKDLPGKPDIVFPRHRKVILVHGCFWHGHERCAKAKRPETNHDFWERKLSRNAERDQENVTALRRAGWRVLVVWQCETRNHARLTAKISRFLGSGSAAKVRQ